jgi:hypothetical protein
VLLLIAGWITCARATEPPLSAVQSSEGLHTRWWNVDTELLRKRLPSVLQPPGQQASDHESIPTTGPFFPKIMEYFKQFGLDLSPPKNMFYSDTRGMLMVRATLEELEMVEYALEAIKKPPQQITLEVRWAEFDADESVLIFNWLGLAENASGSVVNSPASSGLATAGRPGNQVPEGEPGAPLVWVRTRHQYDTMLQKIRTRPGIELISESSVTTFGGTQVQPDQAGESRPAVGLFAKVRADGYAIDLTAIQNVREFVGYDLDGHKDVWDYVESRGANAEPMGHRTRDSRAPAPEPVRIFRDRTAESKAILWDGQTMVLGGLSRKPRSSLNKVPLLDDLPLAGSFFMSPIQEKRTNVLIFITPTLMDSRGKPLHTAEDMPFSEKTVPAQMPSRTPTP